MSDTIVCDFVFVPNGAPFPADWVRRHPDYISLPARFTGSPAFMDRMFGKRRPEGRYVFDKTMQMPTQLGQTEANVTQRPPAQVQSRLGFDANPEPIQVTDGISDPIAVLERGADRNAETPKRDIWTGVTKEELLGPGLANLERRAGRESISDFVAGLDFGFGAGKFSAEEAKLPPGVADAIRIAAIGDLKCEGFPGVAAPAGAEARPACIRSPGGYYV